MKNKSIIKLTKYLLEWFKSNLIAPRELKIKRIKRNNHYLLFFSAAFGLFGLTFTFVDSLIPIPEAPPNKEAKRANLPNLPLLNFLLRNPSMNLAPIKVAVGAIIAFLGALE